MADNAFECSLESGIDTADEDRMLVRAARKDAEAAGRLYDKYYSRIFGYIYHCVLNQAVTEDLTSNVFLAAFRHLGRYRWRQIPFQAWLYRIATNEVRMHYRSRKCAKAAAHRNEDHATVGAAPSADGSLAAVEEYRLVHEAMLGLDLKHRTVIILRYFEDKTIEEISNITGRRQGTVKSQLHRGLAHLQKILVQRGVLPE
jgi:RNA polymerase sigma-70 factor (ECF subfamily)